MEKPKKTEAFPRVKVTKNEYQETMNVIDLLDIPFSQIAREAIREKIASLKKTDPRLQEIPALEAA